MSDDAELIARLRKQSSAGRANHVSKADRLAAADRIEELEALVKVRREDALELLAAHGQAQEAYEAQLKAEARADAAEAERDKHRRNWERAFNANTALEAQIAALTAQVERLTGAERAERDAAYAEGFADAEAEPLYALIQKGGDACDKDDDPTNARPATSPGVTAGAIPLPPDPAAIREAALREAAALCFKNADGITEAVSAFPQIKKRRVLLQRAEQSKVDAAAIFGLIPTKGAADDR